MGCRQRRNEIMCATAVHGKAVGDCALRCAGLFYLLRMRQQCCKLTSCAARASKGQQERESKKAEEAKGKASQESSRSLQDAFAVDFCSPPPRFL